MLLNHIFPFKSDGKLDYYSVAVIGYFRWSATMTGVPQREEKNDETLRFSLFRVLYNGLE